MQSSFKETLPAYCIPKVVRLKTGEVLHEKSYMSPRPPPKISLRHDWAKREVPLGSTVDQQSEGEVENLHHDLWSMCGHVLLVFVSSRLGWVTNVPSLWHFPSLNLVSPSSISSSSRRL